jgi:hypothetical protein
MKKIFLLAASAAMIFASCSKDENTANQAEKTQLSVKLSGVVGTRALDVPGSTEEGTIQLTNGHIFVLDNLDKVAYNEELDVDEAQTAEGQRLEEPVANDSRVYVLGNIPADDMDAVADLTTLAEILAFESDITTQDDYTEVALSNKESEPATIALRTGGAGAGQGENTTGLDIYEAKVQLVPLVSRIELLAIEGTDKITSFNVAGVYVDDYYPSFVYDGSEAGEMFEQHQATTYAGDDFYATEDELAAVENDGKFIASYDNQIWAFNVAAGSLPRLLIKLTDVKYIDDNGDEQTLDEKWLTVTGYNGGDLEAFERGKIYRLGVNPALVEAGLINDEDDMGEDPFEFGPEDLGETPNPKDVELWVMVEVLEWDVETPIADL